MIVDVSYGGENGFNQAIELSADCLGNVKFVKEKAVCSANTSTRSAKTAASTASG